MTPPNPGHLLDLQRIVPWADDTLAALGGAASLSTSANAVGPLSDPFSACMLLALAMLLASGDPCSNVSAPFGNLHQAKVCATSRQTAMRAKLGACRQAGLIFGKTSAPPGNCVLFCIQQGDTDRAKTYHRQDVLCLNGRHCWQSLSPADT